MKLKFETHKLVDLTLNETLGLTLVFLADFGYSLINKTDSCIIFKYEAKSWKLVSKSSAIGRVDEGRLEFIERKKQTDICLIYYVPIDIWLIQLAMILAMSTYMDYKVLFLSIIPILTFILKIQNIKHNFIDKVLGE